MGFEFIYAYLENLAWFFWGGLIISSLALIFLFIARLGNDIDRDDWILFLAGGVFIWFLFLVVCLSPSMEHIREVRAALTKIEGQTETKKAEPILNYPNSDCNSIMCRATVN